MRNRWQSAMLAAALVVIALVATGCSSGSDEADTATAETEQTTPEPAVEPTARPEPTPGSTADTLTLAQAKDGVDGQNWFVELPDDGEWGLFDAADGEPIAVPNSTRQQVQVLMITAGTPDDDWVEVLVPWSLELERTAWLPTDGATFEATNHVLELVRSTGEMRLWQAGEVIWEGQDINDQWRRDDHVPLVSVAATVGTFPGGRENFHPTVLAATPVLHDMEVDYVPVVGIRGAESSVDPASPVNQERPGWSAWVSDTELDALLELIGAGARLEIVE